MTKENPVLCNFNQCMFIYLCVSVCFCVYVCVSVCVCSHSFCGDRNQGLSARLTFAGSQAPSIMSASKMGFAAHSRLYGV